MFKIGHITASVSQRQFHATPVPSQFYQPDDDGIRGAEEEAQHKFQQYR